MLSELSITQLAVVEKLIYQCLSSRSSLSQLLYKLNLKFVIQETRVEKEREREKSFKQCSTITVFT